MLLKLGCDPASWVPVSGFTQATPNPSGQPDDLSWPPSAGTVHSDQVEVGIHSGITELQWRRQSLVGEGGGGGIVFFSFTPPRHLFPTISPRGMKLRWVPSEKKALLRSTGGGCVAVPPVWLSCLLWSSASGETQGESSTSPPHPGRTFR